MLVTVIAFVKLSEFAAAFVAFWQKRVDLKVEDYWSAIKLAPQRRSRPRSILGWLP